MPLRYSPEGQIIGGRAESVPDAKIIIKELKLKKKELQLQKKEIAARIAQVKAEHRSAKVRHVPVARGKGLLKDLTRAIDKSARHSTAVNVDNAVRELEGKKTAIDEAIARFDQAVLGLERFILEKS
jgi:hypothetical protein